MTNMTSNLSSSTFSVKPGTAFTMAMETGPGQGAWSQSRLLRDVMVAANYSGLSGELVGLGLAADEYVILELVVFSLAVAVLVVSVILFLLSQTLPFYADNVAQVAFEISLIVAFVFHLLQVEIGPLSWSRTSQVPCVLAVAGLQFSYLAAFSFLLLESLVVLYKLVDTVMLPNLDRPLVILLAGLLPPFLYTAATVPPLYGELVPPTKKMCWVNLSSPAAVAPLLPAACLCLAAVYALTVAIVASDDSGRRPISAQVLNRDK